MTKHRICPLGNDISSGCRNCCFKEGGSYKNIYSCYLRTCSVDELRLQISRHVNQNQISYQLLVFYLNNLERRRERNNSIIKVKLLLQNIPSERKKHILHMKFIQGKTLNEIASMFNITKQRVMQIINQTITSIRSKQNDYKALPDDPHRH